MLNGKKSYLLSFTALFTKKGYELKLGLDYMVNVNNNYHLTAPVNSTYSAFLEETMKNAGKVPTTATGVFGTSFQADYSYDIEGAGMESVLATVVNYLNDIHEFLAAESSAARAPMTVQVIPAPTHSLYVPEAMDLGGIAAEIQRSSDAESECLKYGEGHITASSVGAGDMAYQKPQELDGQTLLVTKGFPDYLDVQEISGMTYSEQITPETWEAVEEIIAQERQKVTDPIEYLRISENKSTEYISKIQALLSSSRDDMIEGEPSVQAFSPAKLPRDTTDAVKTEYLPVRNVTEELQDAEIQGELASDSSGADFAAVYEVLKIASGDNPEAGPPQEILFTNTYSAGLAELTENTYGGTENAMDADSDFALAAENHSNAGGCADSTIFIENMRHTVADDPEVTRLARLMEIMYGSEIFEQIESGIEDIVVKASSGYLSEANLSGIKESVIESLQEALSGKNTDAICSLTEVAGSNGSLEGVAVLTETADSSGNSHAINSIPEIAASNNNVEADSAVSGYAMIQTGYAGALETPVTGEPGQVLEGHKHEIGKALSESSGRLAECTYQEQAISRSVEDSVMQLTEETVNGLTYLDVNHLLSGVAEYRDRFENVGIEEIEAARYKDYLTYQNHKENTDARYIKEFNAVDQTTERSLYRDREFGSDLYLGSGADLAMNYDSQVAEGHSAQVDAPDSESVLHDLDGGHIPDPEGRGVMHAGETAESVNYDEILLEYSNSGAGESMLDALKNEDSSNSTGEVILPAALEEINAGYSGTVLGGVTQTGELANDIHSFNNGDVSASSEAENIVPVNRTDVEKLYDSVRKKLIRKTDIQQNTNAGRQRQQLETKIEASPDAERKRLIQVTETMDPLGAKRKKKIVETGIPQAERATRHKMMETTIGEAEEGQLITHPASKKARLWLIAGKISSWSIWNWKKTR